MDTLIEQAPKFVDLINKGGVVALLVLICGVLIWEVRRLRKLAVVTFAERDGYRIAYVLYKSACDREKITVDISALQALPIQLAPSSINSGG